MMSSNLCSFSTKKENLVRHCCFHNVDISVRAILILPQLMMMLTVMLAAAAAAAAVAEMAAVTGSTEAEA